MKLFYRKFGEGQPLIILHGLFGQSDNWNSLARQFSELGNAVYTVDLRNHGLSPHREEWTYQSMSDDVLELITDLELKDVILIGHSMGGKVAMQFAMNSPELLKKLIVVDIAPKYYPPHHGDILKALNAVDFNVVKNRKDAEAILSEYISDLGTKQFLLKNIYWKEDGLLAWRFNLDVITRKIETVGQETPNYSTCKAPTLFIKGERSNYILESDLQHINDLFPFSQIKTIDGAGHWVHAEKPRDFFETVTTFIKF
ncbi:MAG: alpha/beta fold hydrolase [Bacteroidia bacterium]